MRPLSDEERAENWRAVRRYLRRYFIAMLVPFLALIYGAGYAQGLLDDTGCLPARNERNLEQ